MVDYLLAAVLGKLLKSDQDFCVGLPSKSDFPEFACHCFIYFRDRSNTSNVKQSPQICNWLWLFSDFRESLGNPGGGSTWDKVGLRAGYTLVAGGCTLVAGGVG